MTLIEKAMIVEKFDRKLGKIPKFVITSNCRRDILVGGSNASR